MRAAFAIMAAVVMLAGCESGGMWGMKDSPHKSHIVVLPDQVKFEPSPPGLPPGAKFAALEGDPSRPGFFTMRGWLPDGYRIAPHFHPGVERLTVLSGTLYMGVGDRFDESAARALPAGSYTSMPPGMHHFAWAKGDAVIQVSTIGPWGITYVNPDDDPRKTQK